MKLIPTRLHGVLDYLSVAALLFFPYSAGWSKRVRRLTTGAALTTLAYSLLTRYELGLFHLLSMKDHLLLDGLSSTVFSSAPKILRGEDSEVVNALVGFGLFELAVVLTSQSSTPQERR